MQERMEWILILVRENALEGLLDSIILFLVGHFIFVFSFHSFSPAFSFYGLLSSFSHNIPFQSILLLFSFPLPFSFTIAYEEKKCIGEKDMEKEGARGILNGMECRFIFYPATNRFLFNVSFPPFSIPLSCYLWKRRYLTAILLLSL